MSAAPALLRFSGAVERDGLALVAPALEALIVAAHRDMVERVEEQSRCLK